MLRLMALGVAIAIMQSGAPSALPADFGLRLEFGCAGSDIVDTFSQTYTRVTSRGEHTATVEISRQLKEELFKLVTDSRFFETASHVTGFGLCEPSTDYRLEVRRAGTTHVVTWGECHLPDLGDEARRMRALADKMLERFQAMPSVKQLRQQDLICL
jgi:hypothetical protein